MNNPIKSLSWREWCLWLVSLAVVLIVLWVMASMENPAYNPVAVNFAIFLLNDLYGFISWKKREVLQTA